MYCKGTIKISNLYDEVEARFCIANMFCTSKKLAVFIYLYQYPNFNTTWHREYSEKGSKRLRITSGPLSYQTYANSYYFLSVIPASLGVGLVKRAPLK